MALNLPEHLFERNGADECWPWTGALTRGGYGCVRRDGRTQRAHRWIYTQAVGPIPDGLDLDHLCRNRACVNPAHLEPVTRAENLRRGDTTNARADATHCTRGHEYTPENTYRRPSGAKRCRECTLADQRVRRAS